MASLGVFRILGMPGGGTKAGQLEPLLGCLRLFP